MAVNKTPETSKEQREELINNILNKGETQNTTPAAEAPQIKCEPGVFDSLHGVPRKFVQVNVTKPDQEDINAILEEYGICTTPANTPEE